MDSIELSLILDCFGDQITIKSTKTYTIWLETIAKVLNMLIGLKGTTTQKCLKELITSYQIAVFE